MFVKYGKCYNHEQRGFITLISVLIVGAVGAVVTVSLIVLGLGASRTSFAFEESTKARALANACAEEALEEVWVNESFAGNGTITIPDGSCTYVVNDGGGENRIIEASATVRTLIRKVKITVEQINPEIRVSSWQEVADF